MVVIIISGMPAVGKTTIARALAREYGLTYYCGGDALKEIALEQGFEYRGNDWWDTPEGMKFQEERRINPEFDRMVDKKLADTSKRNNVIISSYPLPWLVDEGVKIWLKASPETRARRMSRRDRIGLKEAVEIIRKRDMDNTQLYGNLYGIRFGEDLSVFDFMIGTDKLRTEAVIEIASTIVRQIR